MKVGGRPTGPTIARIQTALGPLLAATTDDGLAVLEFAGPRADRLLVRLEARRGLPGIPGDHSVLDALRRALASYFAGDAAPCDVPLDPGGTPFQRRCWAWLATIPRGETRAYAEAALAIGTSPRAFGHANAANPLAILVPCHRIVGSGGDLTGYGGGLDRKRALLALERNGTSAQPAPSEASSGQVHARREPQQLPAQKLDRDIPVPHNGVVELAQREPLAQSRPLFGDEGDELELAGLV